MIHLKSCLELCRSPKNGVCASSAWLCQRFPSSLSPLQSSLSVLSTFMFVASFLRETFSVLVTGLEHSERKSVSITYVVIAFSVQLMILQEIVTELSKTLKPYILMGTAVTLADLFWLWWSASVALEFCMGLLCHRGSWSY